jgi:hypothetical protein
MFRSLPGPLNCILKTMTMNSNERPNPRSDPKKPERSGDEQKPVASVVGMAGAAIASGKRAEAEDNRTRSKDTSESTSAKRKPQIGNPT